jgi:APA family basic amino acid/polyamine antiporter
VSWGTVARRRRPESLSRAVGIGGLLGTAYGYVGTSIYFVLGAIALYALGVTPVLLVVVGLLFIVTSWSYAEASTAFPDASGVTSFARRAFDPMTGFVAAWALLLDSAVMVAITCLAVPHYLGALWPQLQAQPYDLLSGVAVLVIVITANILGLQESVRLSSLAAVLGLATLVLLLVVGLLVMIRPGEVWSQIDVGIAPTWASLLWVLPLAAASFLGLDAISSRAESALHPARDVPRTIRIVPPIIVALSAGLGLIALSVLPVEANVVPLDPATGRTLPVAVVPADHEGAYVMADDPSVTVYVPVRRKGAGYVIPAQKARGPVFEEDGVAATRLYGTLLGSDYLRDPVMGIVDGLPEGLSWLEPPLRVWVAIVVSLALILAANAITGGSGRILYSLARHRQVPALLGRVAISRMTPYMGIVLFGVAAGALLFARRDPLALFGAFGFGAMIAFTLTHLSVIALRYRERSLPRPFVVPFGIRFRGALLPLPAVLGAAACAAIWLVMVLTHPGGRIVGFVWMAVGLVLYIGYRRTAGRPLLRQPKETPLPPSAMSDVDYERILVPVNGTRLSDEMMVLACQLATEKGAIIDVVYVVEVPMNLPLDASMERERARGTKVLDIAMAVAAEFGVEAWPHLVLARRAGRAIVETAGEWSCDVVVIGAPRTQRGDTRLVGGTVDYVMRHAPGEVLLNLVPHDYPMEGTIDEIEESEGSAAADLVSGSPGE